MKQVRERLFIGSITDANSVDQGFNTHIKFMLSLLSDQVLLHDDPDSLMAVSSGGGENGKDDTKRKRNVESEGVVVPKCERMFVNLKDMESENILDHLESCVAFVENGVKKGDVLVHCLAGISRSSSVVIAFLMRTERLSVNDALESLRQASPSACPNEGFMEQVLGEVAFCMFQLQMFEEMGFKVDLNSAVYRNFSVSKLREAYEKGEIIVSSKFASDPACSSPPSGISNKDENRSSLAKNPDSQTRIDVKEKETSLFRCKKCRRLVASKSNVVTHSTDIGDNAFKWRKKGVAFHDEVGGQQKCTSIFVEPMQWMTSVIEGLVEGKLTCASCQTRLGNFNWAGLQCSCGAWVNPAFQLHKSRIDATWI